MCFIGRRNTSTWETLLAAVTHSASWTARNHPGLWYQKPWHITQHSRPWGKKKSGFNGFFFKTLSNGQPFEFDAPSFLRILSPILCAGDYTWRAAVEMKSVVFCIATTGQSFSDYHCSVFAKGYTTYSTLQASLSGTYLQTLPELVTSLKGCSLFPCSLSTNAVSALQKLWVLMEAT